MFDLSIGVVRTKLLADKARGEGYPVHKERTKKANHTFGSQVTNKLWKSAGKRLREKSMKMLIAQELSNTIELKEKPLNVVAKLMGLSSLPVQQNGPTSKNNSQDSYSHNFSSGGLHLQQQEGHCYHMRCSSDLHIHEKGFKDEPGVNHKLSSFAAQLESKINARHEGNHQNLADKRMALVHQKFVEAKRLATNERLLQSKEFKDALEVLSSNRDIFLKLLEEPNSLFSAQLKELNQAALGTQTKCITILKPTTSANVDHEKSASKERYVYGEDIRGFDGHEWSPSLFVPEAEDVSQPTRIVVLKATTTEMHQENRYMNGDLIIDENIRSRAVARDVTYQMPKDLRCPQNDVYPKASDLSNGYLTEGVSLNRSDDDYRQEEDSDGNGSELLTPTSENYWVHMRSGSPGSRSSLSHAFYSFESTVNREAKKRLSERWESVTSNGINHELEIVKKSSSTLGEMLSIPEAQGEEERADISSLVSGHHEQCTSITRSNSLPASLYHENITEKVNIFGTMASKSVLLKQVPKVKNVKSSFKEKVSSLFLSRMKALPRGNLLLSAAVNTDGILHETNSSAAKGDNPVKDAHGSVSDKIASKSLEEKMVKFLYPILDSYHVEKHGKGIRLVEELWKSEVFRENHNQPSYISELDRPFQENFLSNTTHRSSESAFISNPQALSRSPLISSISRSSNRESLHFDNVPISSLKLFRLFSKEDEEQERMDFIAKLLSSSNLANERSTTLLTKLHSLDSPLDPTLLDGLLDRKGEEAKCRERRSNQMLYFDSVNAALKDLCLCSFMYSYPWLSTTRPPKHVKTNLWARDAAFCVRDAVCFRIKDLISGEDSCTSDKAENSRQYVDCLIKKEVAGCGLAESLWSELDELSKEICEDLLEELLDGSLTDQTGWCL